MPDHRLRQHSVPPLSRKRGHLRGQNMRGLKILLSASALLATLAIAPAARAQVVIDIGAPPVCSYGYYDYAPYTCAPYGFYGPGYFYNGIFLGMGPWAGWGYGHGWGDHRFSRSGGGRQQQRRILVPRQALGSHFSCCAGARWQIAGGRPPCSSPQFPRQCTARWWGNSRWRRISRWKTTQMTSSC